MKPQKHSFAPPINEYALVIVEGASLISLGCLAEPLEYVKQNHFPDSMHISSITLHLPPQNPATGLHIESEGQLEDLRSEFGDQVAQDCCDHALVSFPRQYSSPQPGAAANRLRHYPNVIQAIVRDMCNNIENPLSVEQLSKIHKMSRRQLERIFAKHLGCSPRKYYRDLQLEVAYQLTEQTELSLLEISLASGFTTSPVMARHFKQKFGRSPSELRQELAMSVLKYS